MAQPHQRFSATGCRKLARRVARRVAVGVLLAVIGVGLLMAFEDSLIFFPSRYPEGNWQPEGLPIEDARFQTPDGLRLHGWFIPCPAPRAVVLFAHGNAGNVTHRIDALHRLWELELSVLIFDYRTPPWTNSSPDWSRQGGRGYHRAAAGTADLG